MRAGMRHRPTLTLRGPARLLAITFVLALLFGLVGMGEPLENGLRVARNKANPVAASGDIVVVTIDDKSQRALGVWPWPREIHGDLVRAATKAGADQIVIDLSYKFESSPASDDSLAAALQQSGRAVLPNSLLTGEGDGKVRDGRPERKFARHAQLGTIALHYDYQGSVWRMLYGIAQNGKVYPSFAAIMAKTTGPANATFPINYRITVDSIPKISAVDFLKEATSRNLRGKTVIIGTSSIELGDIFNIPGRGKNSGVFIHVLAAETLKRGMPVSLGWMPMLGLASFAVLFALRMRKVRSQVLVLGLASSVTLALPMMSEAYQWFIDITPALFMIGCAAAALFWRRFRARGTVNLVSGLPNLAALRTHNDQRDRALIVARLINYSKLAAAVTGAGERSLVDQIVQRLTVGGAADHVIFQGDEGIFAWLIEPNTAIGHHVEALHSLFRSPARVDGEAYDLNVTFGVEIGSGRAITQRLNSALVAADEAASEGLKWKYHDPERMKDANWRLSLLGQLDDAIENGEVWVAFQPQMDLKTRRLRGAEALARWTHPEKGPISPHEFVSAAEQGGRIEKLTMFVLDQAVATAARLNRDGVHFDMAVNLSARMLGMKSLTMEVRAILARHGLDPARLTLELTETAAFAGDGSDLAPLLRLRELGIRLSIDDYGTGLSTLDYLKKVPASEIKIDQSFIKAMTDHRSDFVMVQSTIALAHSLNRTVVAEGVESPELLDILGSMGCDTVQGFLIGRPTSAKGLRRRLQDDRRRHVA